MKNQILSEEFIRMQKLAGIITEIKAISPTAVLRKVLFDFPEGEGSQDHLNYEKLGFTVVMNDPLNDILSAELDLTKYDWLAVLSTLDDAASFNLYPNLKYNGKIYGYEEARELADEEAAGDTYDDTGIGASRGR